MGAMPAVFVGHGNPMNAIEDSSFRREWTALGRRLPKPSSILCVSAHWETAGVAVTASESPETIHDFGGFPQALFDVRYPAPGSPALARRVASLLASENVRLDGKRGLDHGAWSVLAALYPAADVPVVQLSLDSSRPGADHYDLARRLAPLRQEGVLVLGTGNIVHNLGFYDPRRHEPYDWAKRFDAKVKKLISSRDHALLSDLKKLGPDAGLAVPTPEHYLPLLYVLALQRKEDTVSYFNEAVETSMSMTSIVIG